MSDNFEDKRKHKRYNTEAKVYFDFAYDLETKVKYEIFDKKEKKSLSDKHVAVTQNISAHGLSFVAQNKVNEGDLLHMELYLPNTKEAIHMSGGVRWCKQSKATFDRLTGEEREHDVYEVGVIITLVEGVLVSESIHYDKEYEVDWSVVLESVFGSYKLLMGEKFKKKK